MRMPLFRDLDRVVNPSSGHPGVDSSDEINLLVSERGERGYGRVSRCGPTVLEKLLPATLSQLTDQVIAPRMSGYVCGGLKLPQLVPRARQSSAWFTTDGSTYPPPAAREEAGRPSATWSGRSPFSSWMQASAVRKSTVPWAYTLPSQPSIVP